MAKNKVIARFKDGTLMKGKSADFFPNRKTFHLELPSGEAVDIETEQLKALFFVKDFEGNKKREDSYPDVVPGGGRKVQIKFKDGESVIGYTQGFSPDRPGFFVIPADMKGNNERIFVITSATEEVTFL
jgi:hypothetical protein